MRKSLKRNKALFGEAIAAAGITSAATLAAAGMGAAATVSSARTQAEATRQQAKTQADALKQQNENNTKLQQESIEFTKQQNELNRDLQKEAQMNIQMALGMQNTNDAKDASKIQVKYGGKTRRKLKNGAISQPLYGGAGLLPFKVTDGGDVLPIGGDNNGMLYEVIGDNHEQSHKAKYGRKTGVGFKFANGQEIEGEGNGNTNLGELLYVTPQDAFFISKHSIGGYNPAKDVLSGTHPLQAYNNQESMKAGLKLARRKGMALGGNLTPNIGITLNSEIPYSDDSALALMQAKQNGIGVRTTAKKGCRVKAAAGTNINKFSWTPNLTGASIGAAANLLGAGISMWGNNRANRYMTEAYNDASRFMIDAYSQMQGIDPNLIRRENYRATHVMPALQSTVVRNNADREAVARATRQSIKQANDTSLSGAAANSRLASLIDRRNQAYAQITQAENQEMRERMAANLQAANTAAITNAQLDLEANKDFAKDYLDVAMYNNDIANQKLMGIAGAKSDAVMGIANTNASTKQTNAASWANALTSSAQTFNNAVQTDISNKYKLAGAIAGADRSSAIRALKALGYSENDIELMLNSVTNNDTGRPSLKNINPYQPLDLSVFDKKYKLTDYGK